MTESPLLVDVAFWLFGIASVVTAWLVFRVDSMVRASFLLLASFVNVAIVLLLLQAEYLSMILIMMMSGEMAIMAIFMVMFMMNPAGLNPMTMVHQHRASIAGGVAAFAVLGSVALFADFPDRPAAATDVTRELGVELLGGSMLVFESAGVALLATMIAAIALASTRGRYGDADDGSTEPLLDPAMPAVPTVAAAAVTVAGPIEDEHAGHAGMQATDDAERRGAGA